MTDLTTGISLVYPIVKDLLFDWNDNDFEIYFRIAYRDSDMQLAAETNDRSIAKIIAEGVVSRMRELKANDRRQINE